jgi:phosphohistidine phosphatase
MAASLELYLIRHGVAEERGSAYRDDTKRPLSEAGTDALRKAACGLARFGVSFDLVLTSPLVRARQTADVLAAALRPRPSIIEIAALAPGGTFQALVEELAARTSGHRIALIGHEPDLSQLAARLAGLRQPLPFKKGAVCRIDFAAAPPSPPGTLRWFLPPAALRKMKK